MVDERERGAVGTPGEREESHPMGEGLSAKEKGSIQWYSYIVIRIFKNPQVFLCRASFIKKGAASQHTILAA